MDEKIHIDLEDFSEEQFMESFLKEIQSEEGVFILGILVSLALVLLTIGNRFINKLGISQQTFIICIIIISQYNYYYYYYYSSPLKGMNCLYGWYFHALFLKS